MTTSPLPEPAVPVLAPLLAAEVAGYCLGIAGPGRVQLVGAALASLIAPLQAAGCAVELTETATPAMPAATFVIAWADSVQRRADALAADRVAVFWIVADTSAQDVGSWEAQAATAGWQQHPAVFSLPATPEGVALLALTRNGIAATDAETQLRASYHGLAAALVRPGDAVLATDAARNEVWRILHQQSRSRWLGVVTESPRLFISEPGLEWISPSHWRDSPTPVDVVITRLSHDGTDWAEELQAAEAALVRSGRLVVVVPLESGRNAQERALMAAIEQRGMVIDRAWWQSLSRPTGLEQFEEVARDAADHLAINPDGVAIADALILMAVKVEGPGVKQDTALQAPNIVAFQRDYQDASVVRLIVAMGLRLESAHLRRAVARKVLQQSAADSADHGAALCVLLYDPKAVQGSGREELLSAARRYIDGPAQNPTVLRWQVSLAFAAAALCQAEGDLDQAAELYARVLGFDVLQFSPLLGTKTTTAAARLGWIHFGRGDRVAARSAWTRGLEEARRLSACSAWSEVVGNPDAPETFALPEFAAVMDEAGCLAAALRLTAEQPLRPGLAWQWSRRSWQEQLRELRTEQQRRDVWQEQLQDSKDWLDAQYHNLTAELGRRGAQIELLARDNAGVRASFNLAHRHSIAETTALRDQLRDLQDQHARLSAQHEQLLVAAQEISAATGTLMRRQAASSSDAISEEMVKLAAAVKRVPFKGLVRVPLRALAAVLRHWAQV